MAEERQKQAELRLFARAARRAATLIIDHTLVNTPTVEELHLDKDDQNMGQAEHEYVIPGAYPVEESDVFSNWDPRFYGMPL
ncbi:hypothetical protein CPB83DRAFT_844476 [Crepidotus variabilis]|uniref:Uncharacterized protein n=1 Tax=Crepidotus variabilis TaxID=179855 RepID=A0A9P6ESB3_9AGAR|nr:hypothetical protein CPB83DRAFT_844476 [Crepidotus variabilis]